MSACVVNSDRDEQVIHTQNGNSHDLPAAYALGVNPLPLYESQDAIINVVSEKKTMFILICLTRSQRCTDGPGQFGSIYFPTIKPSLKEYFVIMECRSDSWTLTTITTLISKKICQTPQKLSTDKQEKNNTKASHLFCTCGVVAASFGVHAHWVHLCVECVKRYCGYPVTRVRAWVFRVQ